MTRPSPGHGVNARVAGNKTFMRHAWLWVLCHAHTHAQTHKHTHIATLFSLDRSHWLENKCSRAIIVEIQRGAELQRVASGMACLSRRHSSPLNLFSMELSIEQSQHYDSRLRPQHCPAAMAWTMPPRLDSFQDSYKRVTQQIKIENHHATTFSKAKPEGRTHLVGEASKHHFLAVWKVW